MKRIAPWFRLFLIAIFFLMFAAWLVGEVSLWRLRWRAESMLADIRSLNVNQSSEADAQSVLQKWRLWGEIQTYCQGESCQYFVRINYLLPSIFRGNPDEEAINPMRRIMDNIGLRSVAAGAGFTVGHGIVTAKGFYEEVGLPVRNWYSRGRAYVPDLAVSSDETTQFREVDDYYMNSNHPSRMARYMKGPYGLLVKFKPDEMRTEKSALMDFRFSCITQFFPCRSEREILPEGWQLLQVRY